MRVLVSPPSRTTRYLLTLDYFEASRTYALFARTDGDSKIDPFP